MYSRLLVIAISILLTACASSVINYRPPKSSVTTGYNVKVIDKPRDAVWAEAIPQLGKQFFVINNLDKESGLVNIIYSGDPLQYVDCGLIHITLPIVGGNDQYIPGALESKVYRVKQPVYLVEYTRKMALEGRVNLIFEKIGENQTRVTANTRYSLNKQVSGHVVGGEYLGSDSSSVTFNSGGRAQFQSNDGSQSTECTPTGKLEKDILSAIN